MMLTQRRPGFAAITALVVIALATLLLTLVTKQILAQRRLAEQRQRQLQADALARAGIEIAAARLLDSPATFVDDKQELRVDSKLRIAVEKTGDDFLVTVEARIGSKDEHAVVRSLTTRFQRIDADGMIRISAVRESDKSK